jgi:hypothetical protein
VLQELELTLAGVVRATPTAACEAAGASWWTEPVSATSSLAFVVAGAWILAAARRSNLNALALRTRTALGVLTVLIGVGSVVQHGPAPAWNPVLHDPPLLGAYALVAADAIADLTGRRMRTWWWLAPTITDVVLAAAWPTASVVAQGTVAAVAVGATLARALARPGVRARTLTALTVLGVGSAIGTLSRAGWPWCEPGGWFGGWLSGHAVWHVLAAAALAIIAPTVGQRDARRA